MNISNISLFFFQTPQIQAPTTPQLQKAFSQQNLTDLSTIGEEKAFSSKKYFAIAVAITAIAVAILPVCFPASIALLAIASWYLWSATIIVINQAAEGSFLENS